MPALPEKRTPNLPAAGYLDEVIGHTTLTGVRKTVRVPIKALQLQMAQGIEGGVLTFLDRAEALANLGYTDKMTARVVQDPAPALNGYYRKDGPSGAGTWTRTGDLPYSVIACTDTGAGTANAIELVSELPAPLTPGAALFVANVFEANTGAVTISLNGAAARPLLTNSGNVPAAGYLTAGLRLLFIDDGTAWQMISDAASAGVLAAAEAAVLTAAESEANALAYQNATLAAVPALTVNSIAELRAFSAATSAKVMHVIGYYGTAQVMGGGMFRKLEIGDPEVGAADDGGMIIVDAAGRRWKRIIRGAFNGFEFGMQGLQGTGGYTFDDAAALNALINYNFGIDTEGPQHSIEIPAGFRLLLKSTVQIPGRLKLHCDSFGYSDMNVANARAIILGSQNPSGGSHEGGSFKWRGLRDLHGNAGTVTGQNFNGHHGLEIRTAQFWDCIELNDCQQFTGAGLLVDARAGNLGWAKQHIQQNAIYLGRSAYNGWGSLILSDSAADASFGGNDVDILDCFANWVDLQVDGLLSCFASSSNKFSIAADDLQAPGGVGIYMAGSFNALHLNFKEGSLAWHANARSNKVYVGNNLSTGFAPNFGSMHLTNQVDTGAPDATQLPATIGAPAYATDVQNLFGVKVEISCLVGITPGTSETRSVTLSVRSPDGLKDFVVDEIVETADATPHLRQKRLKAIVPFGWYYRFDKTGSVSPSLSNINAYQV